MFLLPPVLLGAAAAARSPGSHPMTPAWLGVPWDAAVTIAVYWECVIRTEPCGEPNPFFFIPVMVFGSLFALAGAGLVAALRALTPQASLLKPPARSA
jgi:hypothetical protein